MLLRSGLAVWPCLKGAMVNSNFLGHLEMKPSVLKADLHPHSSPVTPLRTFQFASQDHSAEVRSRP